MDEHEMDERDIWEHATSTSFVIATRYVEEQAVMTAKDRVNRR